MSPTLARGKAIDVGEVGLTTAALPLFEVQQEVDPRAWFGVERAGLPLEIEIGSGKGTFLVQEAGQRPEVNFVGIEWAGEFFRYAADRMRRRGLENVRMLHTDAVEFVRYRMPAGLVSVIHLYFPDPWPKARHHKRRTIQDRTLGDFHRVLRPGGEVRIVTDHEEYWTWIEEHASRNAAMFEREEFCRPESASEDEVVGTNFERKYRREGRPFHAMVLRRIGA